MVRAAVMGKERQLESRIVLVLVLETETVRIEDEYEYEEEPESSANFGAGPTSCGTPELETKAAGRLSGRGPSRGGQAAPAPSHPFLRSLPIR